MPDLCHDYPEAQKGVGLPADSHSPSHPDTTAMGNTGRGQCVKGVSPLLL